MSDKYGRNGGVRLNRITGSRRGFALVLVLAFIVLLTTLAVALLIRSIYTQKIEGGSMAGTQAEQLSISALDLIATDLNGEMAAASTIVTQNNVAIYKPLANTAMVPLRNVSPGISATDPNFSNLIKQSIPGVPFFPSTAPYGNNGAVPILTGASSIPTSTPSANGRTVSKDTWNLPLLLSGAGLTATEVPNWVYYSNQKGVVAATAVDRTLTGRFAYNIYNIGGLLNVNAAGHPSTATQAQIAALKGTLAGADLTQIPGITNFDTLVNWRNTVSATSPAAYLTYVTGLGASSGFLKPQSGDKLFVSRQDLLNWIKAQGTGGPITSDSAPFLTQFSRELNAPSVNPVTPAGSTINYANIADTTGTSNRFAPNVRALSNTTKRADNSTVTPGEPLIKTRFPLSRIAGLGKAGIDSTTNSTLDNGGVLSPATAVTIQRDFGLVWNNTNGSWTYAGASGTTSKSTIETLDVVASENREPNFFEVLKAAILSGSLGKTASQMTNSDTMAYDQVSDYQIIQIGVNTIDQYRADDYPTLIAFDTTNAEPPPLFAGSTNLPMINKMIRLNFRPKAGWNGVQPTYQSYVGGWLVPEFWNPYQASLFAGPVSQPTQLQLIPTNDGDSAQVKVNVAYNASPLPSQDATSPMEAPALTLTASNATLSFSPSALFNTPQVLSTRANVGSISSSNPLGIIADPTPNGFGNLYGIYVGSLSVPDDRIAGTPPSGNAHQVLGSAWIAVDPLSLSVQYQNASGQWQTYDTLKKLEFDKQQQGMDGYCPASTGNVANDEILANKNYLPPTYCSLIDLLSYPVPCSGAVRSDPRTDRFGTSNGYAVQLGYLKTRLATFKPGNPVSYYNPASLPVNSITFPYTYVPLAGGNVVRGVQGWEWLIGASGYGTSATSAGWFNASDTWGNYPGALTDNNPATGNMYYADNDGIVRRAAGAYTTFYMSDTTMLPVMLNHPFYTVGDLGYVNRGEPWKDLNFFTTESADTALLDYFSAYEEPSVTADRISLNTAPLQVIEALLSGAIKTETTPITPFSPTEVTNIATILQQEISKNGALATRGDLVTRVAPLLTSYLQKAPREAGIRALSSVSQTRTWNVLIDLVAQSGKFAPTAQTLDQFTVEGERHVWLSLAIDRFTGKIIDQQLEVVSE